MKIGFFGGAFNPVHNGHINLAEKYIDILNLDKLLIVPTANPPHRNAGDFVSTRHRMNMLHSAFGENKKFEISDIEFKLKGKSYTYNTLKELKEIYNDAEIYLIVGEDQFLYFDKWYRFREILNTVTLCTAQRNKDKAEELKAFAENTLSCKNYVIADFDPVVVSSSEIRERIKNNEKVDGLIPERVLRYIEENELYGR